MIFLWTLGIGIGAIALFFIIMEVLVPVARGEALFPWVNRSKLDRARRAVADEKERLAIKQETEDLTKQADEVREQRAKPKKETKK